VLDQLTGDVRIDHLVTDAGYDSEANHALLRDGHAIRSTIPAKAGRPSKDGARPTGRYRCLMCQRFDTTAYAQRSQVETVFSMLKRNLDGCLWARTYWAKIRQMALKALTHNITILRLLSKVFYRAGRESFFAAVTMRAHDTWFPIHGGTVIAETTPDPFSFPEAARSGVRRLVRAGRSAIVGVRQHC